MFSSGYRWLSDALYSKITVPSTKKDNANTKVAINHDHPSSQRPVMMITESPTIAVDLSISPKTYVQGEEPPTLTITLCLSAPSPITVLTYSGILNPHLALRRRNFIAHDISTDPPSPINLEVTKGGKRAGHQRRKGHPDEKYYITLFPGKNVKIQHPLNIVQRPTRDTGAPVFQAGRAYRLGIAEGEEIRGWWWGTRDCVLVDEESGMEGSQAVQGQSCIELRADPVDFGIQESTTD